MLAFGLVARLGSGKGEVACWGSMGDAVSAVDVADGLVGMSARGLHQSQLHCPSMVGGGDLLIWSV